MDLPHPRKSYWLYAFPAELVFDYFTSGIDAEEKDGHQPLCIPPHREWSVQILGADGESSYWCRHLGFHSAKDFKQYIHQHADRLLRVDIGPMWNIELPCALRFPTPADRQEVKRVPGFAPVRQELRFDVDVAKYQVPPAAVLSKKYWPLLVITAGLLRDLVKRVTGLDGMFFFSGKKGFHGFFPFCSWRYKDSVMKFIDLQRTPLKRWSEWFDQLLTAYGLVHGIDPSTLSKKKREAAYQEVFPRFDKIEGDHLLKCPFSWYEGDGAIPSCPLFDDNGQAIGWPL